MRHTLNAQADRIELVLASHKVPAQVRGGRVTPNAVKFEVITPLGTRVNRIAALAEELALALGARQVAVHRRAGYIEIEVPRQDRPRISLERLFKRVRRVPPATALLGVDENGTPLLLRVDSPDVAHVLIAGTTGSGKTVLMRLIGLSLARWNRQAQVQLVLLDPKGRGLAPLAPLPHVWGGGVLRDMGDITRMLERLVHLMEERDRRGSSWPRMIVLVDELAEVIGVGGRAASRALTRLVQRGREAGIHVIAATQKPSSTLLGGIMKGNFPVRIVGRVASADDARVAAGVGGSGAERLRGHGDFILVTGGEIIRFQAPHVEEEGLRQAVHQLREQRRIGRNTSTPVTRPARNAFQRGLQLLAR